MAPTQTRTVLFVHIFFSTRFQSNTGGLFKEKSAEKNVAYAYQHRSHACCIHTKCNNSRLFASILWCTLVVFDLKSHMTNGNSYLCAGVCMHLCIRSIYIFTYVMCYGSTRNDCLATYEYHEIIEAGIYVYASGDGGCTLHTPHTRLLCNQHNILVRGLFIYLILVQNTLWLNERRQRIADNDPLLFATDMRHITDALIQLEFDRKKHKKTYVSFRLCVRH